MKLTVGRNRNCQPLDLSLALMSTVARSDNATDAGLKPLEIHMRRIVHHELGEPARVLRVEDGPSASLGPDQVCVRLTYAPIHRGDLHGVTGSPPFGTARTGALLSERMVQRNSPPHSLQTRCWTLRSCTGAVRRCHVLRLCCQHRGMYDSLTFTNETVDGAKIMLC